MTFFVWLLLFIIMQISHDEEQTGKKEIQNVQLEEKWIIRKGICWSQVCNQGDKRIKEKLMLNKGDLRLRIYPDKIQINIKEQKKRLSSEGNSQD